MLRIGKPVCVWKRRAKAAFCASLALCLTLTGAAFAEMPRVDDTVRTRNGAFEEYFAQNPDVVGWIQMGGNVDYPVVQRDNTFYMDHDFNGESDTAGSIFLDERNGGYMEDDHMLIYGHNMRSGVMFGDLDLFREWEYYLEHPVITLQSIWESQPRKYVLISLFDASMNRSDPSYIRIVRTAFETEEDKSDFLTQMRSRSMYNIPIEADAEDQFLTLVTCSYTHDNGRFLLFARRLRQDETEEQIRELLAD